MEISLEELRIKDKYLREQITSAVLMSPFIKTLQVDSWENIQQGRWRNVAVAADASSYFFVLPQDLFNSILYNLEA